MGFTIRLKRLGRKEGDRNEPRAGFDGPQGYDCHRSGSRPAHQAVRASFIVQAGHLCRHNLEA